MKQKLFFLLAILLTGSTNVHAEGITDLGKSNAQKYYVIETANGVTGSGGKLYYDGTKLTATSKSDTEKEGHYFAFVKNPFKNSSTDYYLYSVKAKQFVTLSGSTLSLSGTPGSTVTFYTDGSDLNVKVGGRFIKIKGTSLSAETSIDKIASSWYYYHQCTVSEKGNFNPGEARLKWLKEGKSYYITANGSGLSFFADETGIRGNNRSGSTDDAYRFAFIQKDGNAYLWSVGTKKFVTLNDDNTCRLTKKPDMAANTVLETGTGNDDYPVVVCLGDRMYCQAGRSSIFNWYGWLTDANNMVKLEEAGDFDPTEAETLLAKYPLIKNLGETSNYKCYTIRQQGNPYGLYNKDGESTLTSTNDWNDKYVRKSSDTHQQFAIIHNDGKYYLYSVRAKKFVSTGGKSMRAEDLNSCIQTVDAPGEELTLRSTGNDDFPVQIQIGGQNVQMNDYHGNIYSYEEKHQIYEADDFDPTEALLQLSGLEGKCFTIQTERLTTNWYVPKNNTGEQVNVTALAWEPESDPPVHPANSTFDSRQLFALAKSAQDGSVYLYHVASGKFLTVDRTGWICLSDEPRSTAVLGDSDGSASYPYIIGLNGDKFVAHVFDVDGSNWFGSWERSYSELAMRTDPGCRVSLTPVRALTDAEKKNVDDYHAVDYKVTYTGDGSVVFKRRIAAKAGTTTLPVEFFDNGLMTYAYNPSAIGNSTKEVNIAATWNGPFELSSDYASAQWYWLRNGGRNLTYLPGGTCHVTRNEDYGFGDYGNGTALPADASLTPDVQWAFIGSPYTGLTIVNRLAGDGWKLVKYVAEGNKNEADMRSSTATGEQDVWYPSKSNVGTGGFQLGLNANGTGDVLNSYYVSPLRFWGYDIEDGNNAWYCAPVPDDWSAYVVRDLASFFQEAKDKPFTLPASEQTDLAPLYTSRSASATYEDYIDLVTTVAKKVIYPESGRYQIKSAVRKRYIGYGYKGNDAGLVTLDDKYASTVLTLTRSGAAFPYTYTIATENDKKAVIPDGFGGRPVPIDIEGRSTPTNFTFLPSACGEFVIRYGNGRSDYLYEWAIGSAYAVANWLPADAGCKWCIEDATQVAFTLNPATDLSGHKRAYATTYLPFGVTLPDGVAVYVLSEISTTCDDRKVVYPVSIGQSLPKGTPVLLASDGSSAVKVVGTINDEASATVGTNILRGTYWPEVSTGTSHLVLNKNADNHVGFFNLASGKILAANRAYIPSDNVSSAKGFVISWDFESGVEAAVPELPADNTPVFDLQGRRVGTTQTLSLLPRGLYIINGKKVLVK